MPVSYLASSPGLDSVVLGGFEIRKHESVFMIPSQYFLLGAGCRSP